MAKTNKSLSWSESQYWFYENIYDLLNRSDRRSKLIINIDDISWVKLQLVIYITESKSNFRIRFSMDKHNSTWLKLIFHSTIFRIWSFWLSFQQLSFLDINSNLQSNYEDWYYRCTFQHWHIIFISNWSITRSKLKYKLLGLLSK